MTNELPAPPPLITFSKDEKVKWTDAEKNTISNAALEISNVIAKTVNEKINEVNKIRAHFSPTEKPQSLIEPEQIFYKVFGGPIEFKRVNKTAEEEFGSGDTSWGACISVNKICIFKNAPFFREGRSSVSQTPQFTIHEIGHAFENAVAREMGEKRGRNALPPGLCDNRKGFYPDRVYQQSPSKKRGEIFADMFIGWVYNKWETQNGTSQLSVDGFARKDFMDRMMYGLILNGLGEPKNGE